MRAFIAIELPQEIKDVLAKLQAKLKLAGADVKWVEPKNIHLTLKFLGEIDEQAQKRITAKLEEISSAHQEFVISLSSCGAFPSINSPRVIWAGIEQGDKEVSAIAEVIETQLESIGIPKETREFSSHITLGRTRSSKNRHELAQALSELSLKPLKNQFPASKITLFKSTLTPRGPIYETLQEFPL
ncbi:MAG: RNA 2',3'-cyclic phosphodiesterase [Candidatus Omnitrophica bacterium]|nr:RNA 2',3'-cyclic phosphodiesterase [Candidatus Omnitrophota bacterium]